MPTEGGLYATTCKLGPVLEFLAAPALAQTKPAETQATTPPAQMQSGQTAAGAMNFVQRQQAQELSAEWLSGSNVYNRQDENLGTINDMIIGADGQVKAVVIGVGGFLGIGEKNVAVAFDALDINPAPEGRAATTAQAPATAPTTGQATPATQSGQQARAGNETERRIYLDANSRAARPGSRVHSSGEPARNPGRCR